MRIGDKGVKIVKPEDGGGLFHKPGTDGLYFHNCFTRYSFFSVDKFSDVSPLFRRQLTLMLALTISKIMMKMQ